jgi:hypothetical protein
MSLPTWIGVVWGGATLALMLLFWSKPFYGHWRGEKIRLHTPALKFLVCAFFAGFLTLSIVPHIILRFVGFRGFWDAKDKSYTLMNPFKRRGR